MLTHQQAGCWTPPPARCSPPGPHSGSLQCTSLPFASVPRLHTPLPEIYVYLYLLRFQGGEEVFESLKPSTGGPPEKVRGDGLSHASQ